MACGIVTLRHPQPPLIFPAALQLPLKPQARVNCFNILSTPSCPNQLCLFEFNNRSKCLTEKARDFS
jgi:hypothetical protein